MLNVMSKISFIRPQAKILLSRLREPRQFLQVISGARQVGKTTLITQIIPKLKGPYHFASADEPGLRQKEWIAEQWTMARLLSKESKKSETFLVLDEIQKIPKWNETVKKLWDEDTRQKSPLKVILLGSAPLLMGQGLTESLAGRFEVFYLPHWSFLEMKKAFGWTLNQFLFYGSYPGSAGLIKQPDRWSRYIRDSLIETAISRDVFLMSRVDKPALLRRLFELACSYSGQILSWTKMIGQLQEKGNTTTLAYYLHLLEGAGLIAGLQKYAGEKVRQKGSSPKLQVLNTALITALSTQSLSSAHSDKAFWGRLVESAVGAHLINGAKNSGYELFYWRQGHQEVDFVVRKGKALVAIEVKSQNRRDVLSGMSAFASAFKPTRKLVVGHEGITIEQFLSKAPEYWLF